MPKFEIKNPNGSRVFVKNTLVMPYSNFQAELDPSTVDELKKFGVSVRPVIHATPASSPVLESPPAAQTAEAPVLRSAIVSLPDNVAAPVPTPEPAANPDDAESHQDEHVEASDESDPSDANVNLVTADLEPSAPAPQWETREERRQRKKGRS